MFFRKDIVEEDLERIREARLPKHEEIDNSEKHSDDIALEKGDILAMILAVMSLIVPYIIAFLGIMGAVLLLMKFYWR